MYAIVDIAGQQVKVKQGEKFYVNRLENKEGENVSFDKVLLIDNEKNVLIGEPYLKDAVVNATIISHLKGDKVLIFKKKRRKGYRKLNGHRQYLTQITIDAIAEKGGSVQAKAKVAEPKAEEPKEKKVAAKTTATKATPKKDAEKAPAKKASAAKKPAAKKTTTAAKKTETTKKAAPKKETTAKKPAAKKPAAKKTTTKKEDKE